MPKNKLNTKPMRNDGSMARGVHAVAKLNRDKQEWDRDVIRSDLSDFEYLEGLLKLKEHLENVIADHKSKIGL